MLNNFIIFCLAIFYLITEIKYNNKKINAMSNYIIKAIN